MLSRRSTFGVNPTAYIGSPSNMIEVLVDSVKKSIFVRDQEYKMEGTLQDFFNFLVSEKPKELLAGTNSEKVDKPLSLYITVFVGNYGENKNVEGIIQSWAKEHNIRIVEGKKSKVQEQEKDSYTEVAKGIVDKEDADKVAADKKGTVIADKDDPKKFAVIVKESTIKEDATSIKELETSIIGAMDKIGFDHFVGRRETEDGRVLEFRHPSGIDMEVLIKGHWYQRMKKEQEKGTADYS